LKKNGIDSPKASKKNLTAKTTVELLKEAGRLPSVPEPVMPPIITATAFFAIPRFILGLPLRMFASKKKEEEK
jgi:hypothetical protein